MRSKILALSIVFAALAAIVSGTKAAQDVTAKPRVNAMELLVFEHAQCQYCRVFRRDVMPQYKESPQSARAPLRFVDVGRTPTEGMGLNAAVYMVPTFVLMKDGKEVDRITGYWAPENFFKMLAYILLKSE